MAKLLVEGARLGTFTATSRRPDEARVERLVARIASLRSIGGRVSPRLAARLRAERALLDRAEIPLL